MDEENFKGLINDLRDDDSDVRRKAKNALLEIGEPAVEPLIKALDTEDSDIQSGAAEVLGELGDARAVEPLIKALKDKKTHRRLEIVGALEKLGWTPGDNIEKAYYLLVKRQWNELGRLGEPAVAPLIQAMKDEDENVRLKAVEALGEIYLIQALKHKG